MKSIVIIGGGFAGLSAAAYLMRYKKQAKVVLVDRKRQTDFLPLLPDILSRRVDHKYLSADLKILSGKFQFDFINSDVRDVDTGKNRISLTKEDIFYDYLIIASGSQTNFYGDAAISKSAFKLDDVSNAKAVLNCLETGGFENFIISGGGYTGVEIAANIRRYFFKKKEKRRIVIVEKAPELLAILPQWMRKYVLDNLADLGVEIRVNAQIKAYSEGKIMLSDGESFTHAALIWAAGVKTQDFIKSIGAVCDRQGRVIVDEYLRLNSNCFCCGDTAHFEYKGNPLRMSVQFSIMQGRVAAGNIVNCIKKQELKKYRPLDLGYIIPMANNKACGNVFGFKVRGNLAVLMHYCMCIFRSYPFRNRSGIVKNLSRML
ncbi:MAG: FAD-dependent oxidoreductase [Candidatus Omnitrophota bacterium]